MNFGSTIDKILNPIEKNGKLLGVGIFGLQQIGVIGGGSNVPLMDSINRVLSGGLHAPEVGNIINYVTADTNTKNALMAAIIGYIGKDITGYKYIDQAFDIAYKIGFGYFVSNMIAAGLYYSTHSPAPGGINTTSAQTGAYTSTPLMGSSLNSYPGVQATGAYQSVYPNNPTSGSLYTLASGARPIGN